ncbi:MFS transporter [Halobacteriales archaeon SW_7_68_16]|nr:MAG: MFS transporter [Halobacteriales archaeon SW_7_68_16]
MFAPLIEPFRATFALSAGEAGLIATLAWLGSALPRYPVSYLLTKLHRRYIIIAAGVVLTGAATFTATAGSLTHLYVGALCMGMASGAYFISANPLISELFPDGVGRAIGTHGTASQIASVSAPAIVGIVLAQASWRTAFRAIAVAAATVTVVLYLAMRSTTLPGEDGDRGDDDTAGNRSLRGAFRAEWRLIATGVFVLGLVGFVWNGLFNFYVTYVHEVKGVGEPLARTLLSGLFAAGVPAFFLSGRLADRLPYVPYLAGIVAAFATAVLGLTLATGVTAVAVATVALGYTIHSLFPAIDTFLLDSMSDVHRGSAYALTSATMMLIQATGSVAVGQLVDAGVPFDTVFLWLVGLVTTVSLTLLTLHRIGRIPTGRRPTPS